MGSARPIMLRGQPIAGGIMPAICTPLLARTREALLAEISEVLPKRPDVVEWRVDFFDALGDTGLVIDTAQALRAAAQGVPLLFTRRAAEEGGERVDLSESRVVELYEAVCAARCVDLIDYELAHSAEAFGRLREASRSQGIALIGSYHDFHSTPSSAAIVERFREAQKRGADVGKVAVMPKSPADVLTLLAATFDASRTLDIAIIGMSMGEYGSVSRMVGAVFGSALTFAVGKASSAPGQIPIEELREIVVSVRRSTGDA